MGNSLKPHGQVMSSFSPSAHARICLKLWRLSVLVFTYSDISQRRPIFLTSSLYETRLTCIKLSGVPSKSPQIKETPVGKDSLGGAAPYYPFVRQNIHWSISSLCCPKVVTYLQTRAWVPAWIIYSRKCESSIPCDLNSQPCKTHH